MVKGAQDVNIGAQCDNAAIVHEFLHALGFFHMQSAPNRDEYIEVDESNLDEAGVANFEKENDVDFYGTECNMLEYFINFKKLFFHCR